MRSTLLAGMSTAKPHGMPESGAPEKYPKPAKGGTRGPWPKGGNFLGSRGQVRPARAAAVARAQPTANESPAQGGNGGAGEKLSPAKAIVRL